MPVDKISGQPACDSKKVFIEVTGIEHNPEYSFLFYDHTDYVEQEFLEKDMQASPEKLDNTTIYSWDWKEQNERIDVWLGIESESGTIRLPLFDDIQPKNRKEDEQDYLLHSVVPLTLLPTFNDSLDYKDRIAPSKNGYVYVFYNNRIWREIEITTNEDGTPSFKDIDLYSYRETDEKKGKPGRFHPLKIERRNATGKTLNEIWLPAKDNDKGARVHLAYSEIQWSGERLNYLENNSDEMAKRAIAFHKLNTIDNVDVLKTELLPEIRGREPEIEMVLAEPANLNHDLSGAWLGNQFSEIKNEISGCSNDGDKALSLLKYETSYQYEYGMKQNALQQLLSPDVSNDDLWQAEAKDDHLKDAKARKLRAIVLDDLVFDLRHHAFCALYGVGYFQQVYVDMSKQEYFKCAELVQKLVFPPKFGEQENALFEYKDEVNQYMGGRFHRTLRTIERQVCIRDVQSMQTKVKDMLDKDRLACTLRDITSRGDINGSAAHKICGYGISALSINIANLDQMTLDEERKPLSFSDELTRILTPERNHPLHTVLFPPKGTVSPEEDYVSPDASNDGSGFASAELITSWFDEWEKANFIINEDQLEMMDLAFMTEASDNEEEAFGGLRRAANITDGIFKGYFDALQELSKGLANEAMMVKFDAAYAPVLSLMKASNSKYWGKAKYVPFGGNPLEGYVVGVHGQGLSYGITQSERDYVNTQKKKTRLGRLYEQNGKLFASTAKSAFKKGDLTPGLKGPASQHVGTKSPLRVLILPEDSELAKAFNKENTQRTLQDLNKSGVTKSNIYEKFKIPYFIVVVETVNLIKNKTYFDDLLKGKVSAYSTVNMISAAGDLAVAITHASNLYTQNASRLAQYSQKIAFTTSTRLSGIVAKMSDTAMLVRHVSILSAVSIGAGFLTAGIALWDSIRLFNSKDYDASIAQGMIFAGTLVTTIATGFFTTSAPLLFGMGPVAWLGIGIALVGFALYMYFKDSPIEIWLKNGPFSDSRPDTYSHLQDNDIAFNRFIGILFNASVKVYPLGEGTRMPEEVTRTMQLRGATHVIWIDTNLAALLNQNMVKTELFVRQAILQQTKTTKRTGVWNSSKIIKENKKHLAILGQEMSNNGYAFFIRHDIKVPKANTETGFLYSAHHSHSYKASFIVRARLQAGGTVFPGPSLDEPTKINPTNLSLTPTFEDDERYWINQVTFSQQPGAQ